MQNPFFGCKSQADIYRRLIDIENDFSPVEMASLTASQNTLPEIALPLMQKNLKWMMRGSSFIRPYRRTKISENVNYFQYPTGGVKSLLMCFCGKANRMLLPIATFLQHIPEDTFDVLILRDPSRHCYLGGVPLYADRLEDVLVRMQNNISLGQYRDIRCLGTSVGGAAALYSGIFLGAKRAIAVGGAHPSNFTDIDKLRLQGFSGTEFDDLLPSDFATASNTELLAFCGAQVKRDIEGAISLSRHLVQCRLAKINNIDDHNIFFQLFERGALSEFFRRYVFADSIS